MPGGGPRGGLTMIRHAAWPLSLGATSWLLILSLVWWPA